MTVRREPPARRAARARTAGPARAVLAAGTVLAAGAVVALAAGCAPGGAGGTGGHGGQGAPGTGSHGSPAGAAPDSLVAAKLAPAAALRAAGIQVTGVEDDGGAMTSGAFASQATAATADGTFVIGLSTYASPGTARSAYQQLTAAQPGTSPSPLPGAGDKAITVGMATYVSKGSQVLSVQARLSATAQARLDAAKASGTLTPALLRRIDGAVLAQDRKLAVAVAGRLTGQAVPATAALSYVPPGGVDPCSVPAASLGHGGITVTSQPELSDSPPALECVYTFAGSGGQGTGELAVYTLTGAQAAAAVPHATVAGYFAAIQKTSSAGGAAGYSTATAGPFSAEGTTAGEPDYVLADAGPGAGGGLLLRIEDQASSFRLAQHDCTAEFARILRGLAQAAGVAWSGQAGQAAGKIAGWCTKEAAAAP